MVRANKNLMKGILLELLWIEGNFICLVFVAEKENFKCLIIELENYLVLITFLLIFLLEFP